MDHYLLHLASSPGHPHDFNVTVMQELAFGIRSTLILTVIVDTSSFTREEI